MDLSLDQSQINSKILNQQSELQFIQSHNQLVKDHSYPDNIDIDSDHSQDKVQLKQNSKCPLQDSTFNDSTFIDKTIISQDNHPTNHKSSIFSIGYLVTLAKLQFINSVLYRQFERMKPKQLEVIRQYSTDHSFYIDDEVIKNKKQFENQMKQQQKMNLGQKGVYLVYIYTLYQIKNIWLRMELQLTYLANFLERYDFTKNQTFRLVWDIFYIMIIIFQCIYLPVYICFDLDSSLNVRQQYLLNYGSLIFLSLDCILNFFTGYFSKGTFITSQKTIALNYLQNFFIIDLISLLPQLLVLNPKLGAPKVIQILFVLKFIRLRQVVNKIEDRFLHVFNRIKTFYHLMILFFGILYTAHITGCILYWLCVCQQHHGKVTMFEEIIKQVENGSPWYEAYIDTFYFSVVTIVTVGYGDYSPKTAFEKLYVVFMILIGCAQHAYSISTIGNIIADINKSKDQVRQKVGELSEYMYRNNVPSTFMIQARKNLEYVLEQETSETKKINQLVLQLNGRIRKQLIQHIYYKNIKKIDCLNNCGFSDTLLERISDIVVEENFGVDNEIKIEGDIYLYYIKKGKAEIQGTLINKSDQNTNEGQCLVSLADGQYFNSYSFFSNQIQKNTRLFAKSHCTVIAIPRQKFVEILQQKQFSEENLIFNKIKDNIVLNDTNMDINLPCYICKSKTHYYSSCPLVFYQPNRRNIIDKSNQPQLNRQPFKRKGYRKLDFDRKVSEDDNMGDSLLGLDRKSSLMTSAKFGNQKDYRTQTRFIQSFNMDVVKQWRKNNKDYLDYGLVEQMTQSSVTSYEQTESQQDSLQYILEEQEDKSRNSDNDDSSKDGEKSSRKSMEKQKKVSKQNRFMSQLHDYRKSRISNLQNLIQANQQKIENERYRLSHTNDGTFQQQSMSRQTQLNAQNNQILQQLEQIRSQMYVDQHMKLKRQLTANVRCLQPEKQIVTKSEQQNNQIEQQVHNSSEQESIQQTLNMDQFREFRQHYFTHNNISNIVKEKNEEQSVIEAYHYALIQVRKNEQKLQKIKQKIQEFNAQNNIEEIKMKFKTMQDEYYQTVYNDKRLQDEDKKKMIQLQKKIDTYQNYQQFQTKVVSKISQYSKTIEQYGNQTKKVHQKRRMKYITFKYNPDLIHNSRSLDINTYINQNYQAYLNALKQKKQSSLNSKKMSKAKKRQTRNVQKNIEMQMIDQNNK